MSSLFCFCWFIQFVDFIGLFKEPCSGDFPGCPVVKTLPSNAGGAGSIPGWGAKIPHASWPKKPKHKIEAIL